MSDGHVFISYVRDNKGEVDEMGMALEAAGIPVWRDTTELWPGDNWRLKIKQAIAKDALVVIACFSGRSLARTVSYQYEELTLAVEQLRLRRPGVSWLIPVRFDDCVIPDFEIGGGNTLRSLQWADLFGAQRERETARLVETVRRILEQGQAPPVGHSARASADVRAGMADGAEGGNSGAIRPETDTRWANISGGLGPDGRMRAMSFEILAGLASEWAALLPDHMINDGPAKLLGMARSQFTYSWFNYEFMVTACFTGFQALEAAFLVLYPEAEQTPFRELIQRARREGILPDEIAELADAGAELHESFSHPRTQMALTLGASVPMLENSHRLVALVMNAAAVRDTVWKTQHQRAIQEDREHSMMRKARLLPGESLLVGQSLYSPDGRTRFGLQQDGNMVVYVEGLGDICDTGTGNLGNPECLKLDEDGWLILYGVDGDKIWKQGSGGARLEMQNNSHVVLYPAKGEAIWATENFVKAGILMRWLSPQERVHPSRSP